MPLNAGIQPTATMAHRRKVARLQVRNHPLAPRRPHRSLPFPAPIQAPHSHVHIPERWNRRGSMKGSMRVWWWCVVVVGAGVGVVWGGVREV